jgi:hypothetical protein
MITESDLRAALTEQARDVSEPDEILARLISPNRGGDRRCDGSLRRQPRQRSSQP